MKNNDVEKFGLQVQTYTQLSNRLLQTRSQKEVKKT